ncbi:metal-dependent hydrolase [Mammaliicoccus stepanovicii]|uniref:UPF0173 metal-dependent hydrolase SAMEA4384403_01045 n=1 Tax=Mammaliicoccus stepanovicii TaxID=643214 RepID=A0A239Z1E0_9STAP|nr:metal-dependent hydrolase [Mammaliicoccus stepanovicii]PNZ78105.1 metal-dependent hydrolase [Mammaliicoccus stepanovicii]GGI40353.1 UPF0173 metal-dependent hydrolase [Mammaliicoccus stepanovicii]SNV64663.1 metal-dependent hydrolase [Mammaliicoccus stepanovicii]
MKVSFHGQSVIYFESKGHKVIVDPFITGNPLSDLKAEDLEVDYIILTHGHGDHLGDTVALAKNSNATVIALPEIIDYLSNKHGLENLRPMNIGGNIEFGFGKVKFVQAFHSNSITEDNGEIVYLGMPTGIILETEGGTIYHTGDTGLFGDMKLIADRHPVDLCFIPIGDNFTMGIDDASYAINELIQPKKVVPIHYDTFDYIKQDPNEFKDAVRKAEVHILKAGDSVEL